MASLTQLLTSNQLVMFVCFGGVVLWMQRERERGYAKLCEDPHLPPGWFALQGVI